MARSIFVFLGTMMFGLSVFRLALAIVKSLNGDMTVFKEVIGLPWGAIGLITASVLFAVAVHKDYA